MLPRFDSEILWLHFQVFDAVLRDLESSTVFGSGLGLLGCMDSVW